MHTHGAMPTDLLGHLTGWYRVYQESGAWTGGFTVGDLEPSQPVWVNFVSNRMPLVTVEVEGVEPPMRFQTPIGTAVPVKSLLAHLAYWLQLPTDGGAWGMYVDGGLLVGSQILDEFEPGPGFVVVLGKVAT